MDKVPPKVSNSSAFCSVLKLFIENSFKILAKAMCKTGHYFLTDFLVKDKVVTNIHIMDELACRLDQPIYHGNRDVPTTQYWLHLAEEFKVSNEVKIRCQHNPENSPSKNMFEFQEGRDPDFTVQMLKDGLQSIERNDLVKKLEQCSLPGEF